MAKSLVLGASAAAMARPLLGPALKGSGEVESLLRRVIRELRVAMTLVGAKDVNGLKKVKFLIVGRLRDLLDSWGDTHGPDG